MLFNNVIYHQSTLEVRQIIQVNKKFRMTVVLDKYRAVPQSSSYRAVPTEQFLLTSNHVNLDGCYINTVILEVYSFVLSQQKCKGNKLIGRYKMRHSTGTIQITKRGIATYIVILAFSMQKQFVAQN